MNKLTPIVMLHYVSDEEDMQLLEPWNITRASFIRLLDFIEKKGYKTVGFEDKKENDPQKSIVITFDDCPKSLWDFAIPELVRRKMKAVFYIATAYIDGIDEWNNIPCAPVLKMMNEKDIKRLVDVGMEVGSHCHRHVMYSKEYEGTAFDEIVYSKKCLEKITGKSVSSIAYPYGDLPKKYYSSIKRAGFKYGNGVFPFLENRFSLGRWIFSNETTEADIEEKITQEFQRKRKLNNPLYVSYLLARRFIDDCYIATKENFAKLHRARLFYRFTRKSWYMALMDISEVWADSYLFSFFECIPII